MPPPSEPPTRTPPSTTLLVYPATLLLGSLFSVLSPTAQYPDPSDDVVTASASASAPINYFARKDNIFNLFFVKLGWIWFTLAFAALLLTYPPSPHRGRRQAQALSRYALATTAWYFVTQWFFGPAIIDRSFVVTGGKCEDALFELSNAQNEKGIIGAGVEDFGVYLTATACKAAGGAWRGGHDVSGHVFMLVLVTAVLGFEAFGVLAQESELKNDADASTSANVNAKTEGEAVNEVRTWTLRFVVGIIGLGWWMLLMTAIWFHTWLEKANGLLISLGTIYTIYFLPRRVIPWRNVVGIPGI
ncbi:inositol phospholipid synthesis and fat-storage-inducing TM-domain-containing protein [Aspergillus falconensis]